MSSRNLKLTSFFFLFLICIYPNAWALEQIATYPLLPTGYSSIKVFDNQSRFVGRLLPEKRYWVTIDRIPVFLQKAVVAVEDSRFYEHAGIDLRGIARAVVKDVVKGRLAEGGSTITQQLIKNRYLTNEKTIDRKVTESLMAIEFEKKYTKQQILEMYLNEIYYGNGAFGIAQAARLYFDKSPEELNESECAILAGIPKNPGRYNPLAKPADIGARRAIVLKRMLALGMISPKQLKKINTTSSAPVQKNQAHWYLLLLKSRLSERFGAGIIEQGGLEITAALDLDLQKEAEKVIREGVTSISPKLQGALISIDPNAGNILAIAGGVDYLKSSYNRALLAKRQPGSAIKPLIFAAALEQGITAASIWNDTPIEYNRGTSAGWKPHNYDGKSHGDLTLRQALTASNNVIAVKLLEKIGTHTFADFASKLGVAVTNRNDLSVALGTEETTLHDLLLAYTPLATGGVRPEPRSIIRIYNSYQKSWTDIPPSSSPVISPAAAFITSNILKDVLTTGTAKRLKKFSLKYPAAGKTGTTSDYKDAWFIGYTTNLVTGVWVGYDQPKSGGRGFTGGAIAAPIWERFMRFALSNKSVPDFTMPDDVISVTIDSATGFLATAKCPVQRNEFFTAGTEPSDYCPKHGDSAPNPENQLPETKTVPAEDR